jgi:hypothetical protein
MHIVQQLTPFTCFLACLESFTTERGKPYTQCDLLTKYRQRLYNDVPDKGDFGASSDTLMEFIWTDLGYKGAWLRHANADYVRDQVFNKLGKNQAIFILSDMHGQGWHCIRFEKVLDDQTIAAMVPQFPGVTSVDPVKIADLVAWKYMFAVLSP